MFEGEKLMSTHTISIEQTMETVTMPTTHASISKKQLWAGRILSGLPAAFMVLDGGMKLFKPAPVVKATLQLGYAESVIVGLGIVLLASTMLYLIPRTALLGAILLTGYLGGAVATNVRVGAPLFNITFPVFIGALLWGGLWFRDQRLRELLPLRQQS
jgi:DoxX-like family